MLRTARSKLQIVANAMFLTPKCFKRRVLKFKVSYKTKLPSDLPNNEK
jgi:hypothetical protein